MSDVARILVVEDNPDNMTLMSYLLGSAGYSPILAETGAEGVDAGLRHRPHLVLLDIQLPDVDGFEVAAALSAARPKQPFAIVAVTAFAMVGDKERVISSGFDGYLTKPITPETFVRDVERFLPDELRATPATSSSSA